MRVTRRLSLLAPLLSLLCPLPLPGQACPQVGADLALRTKSVWPAGPERHVHSVVARAVERHIDEINDPASVEGFSLRGVHLFANGASGDVGSSANCCSADCVGSNAWSLSE